jgi:hypothetical protein
MCQFGTAHFSTIEPAQESRCLQAIDHGRSFYEDDPNRLLVDQASRKKEKEVRAKSRGAKKRPHGATALQALDLRVTPGHGRPFTTQANS